VSSQYGRRRGGWKRGAGHGSCVEESTSFTRMVRRRGEGAAPARRERDVCRGVAGDERCGAFPRGARELLAVRACDSKGKRGEAKKLKSVLSCKDPSLSDCSMN
jgi:hypothetical protein